MSKPRVLLLSDVRGWAFDQQFQDLVSYLNDDFDFELDYVRDWLDTSGECLVGADRFQGYDVIFAPYHRWGIDTILPMRRTLGSLRARWLFPEDKHVADARDFAIVNRYRAFHVVTRANYDELKDACPELVYLTNPINTRRFTEPIGVTGRVRASWNGNAGHSNLLSEDVKGFHSIIVPACLRAGVELEYAEQHFNYLEPREMPVFYRRANVSLCASLYEGASSSVMESMAAGQAVIATDVGNHREMMESQIAEYGDTGIVLVERSIDAFVDALEVLMDDPERVAEMGRLNRLEIQRAWSWDAWADRYRDFLMIPVLNEGSLRRTSFAPRELLCPTCGTSLEPQGHRLWCARDHAWAVRGSVAQLVPPDVNTTIDSFEHKWRVAPETMKEERKRIAVGWFLERFGTELNELLPDAARVLEAGCGLGHLTEELARRAPGAEVWGIDMTQATEHVERLDNLRVVRGDLTRLPISGDFDLIISDGVLHHTADTWTSLATLADRLAPGGSVLFYVYKRKAPLREICDDLVRDRLAGSDPRACLVECEAIADLGRQLREARVTIKITRPIPALGIAPGSYDLQRFIFWHFFKCFWDDGGDLMTSTLENFDWYHPPLAWRHTMDEVRAGMTAAGLEIMRVTEHDSGIAAHGRKG